MQQEIYKCYQRIIGANTVVRKDSKFYSLSNLAIDSIRNFVHENLYNNISDTNDSYFLLDFEKTLCFVEWSYKKRYPLDWRMPLAYIHFLLESSCNPTEELKRIAIMSACSQWTYADKSLNSCIVIYMDFIDFGFGMSIKSNNASEPRELFFVEENLNLSHSCYFISPRPFESVEDVLNVMSHKVC